MQPSRPFYLVAAAAILVLAACEKVPLTAPTDSTITITLSRTSVALNDKIEVFATVIESGGTPVHNGTMVTFTGPLGTFDPAQAQTVGGIARTTFTGTTSGTGKISAFSGGATVESGDLRVGAAAAERVTVRSEPSTLTATGGTVTIIANVQDASGTALPNTPVNFTTDSGSLSSNSVSTDASGEARVQLTTTKTAKVTAAVGTKTSDVTITAVPAPSVSISGCTASPAVGLPVTCTITPAVTSGGALVTNVSVNWGDGTGDQNLGPITGATSVSHTYARSDVYTVVATATDANGQVGRGQATLNVGRSLPTLASFTCPATLNTNVAGSFSVTPPSNPAIPISNITVDFGDGSSRNLGTPTGPTSFAKAYGSEGNYTAIATITDAQGQRGSSSCSVIVSRSNPPTITTFAQTSNTSPPAVAGGPAESFNIQATAAAGLTIRSVVVTKQDGEVLYDQPSGGTFATSRVNNGDILTARVTDSAGNVATSQLVVQ